MSQNLASFFNDPRENSLVKAAIVSKYFVTWSSIIINIIKRYEIGDVKKPIAYIDLFSGPGGYDEGTPSTPILVLQEAIKSAEILDRIRITFNDSEFAHVKSLRNSIDDFDGIERFRFRPIVHNFVVERELADALQALPDIPTLLFIDAWGYKNISIDLFESILQKWGSDCIFFFNFNRINAGIDNPRVFEPISALFGRDRAENLRNKLLDCIPEERELNIVEAISSAIKESSSDGTPRYVLPFRFRNVSGSRTSHHIIHVSRHFLGYEKMKEIMARESSEENQGVASFEYSLATERQPFLFRLSRPLDELGDMLLREFAGKNISMKEIYEKHSVDTPFIKKNYKDVLWQLEEQGKITASKHRRNSFGDRVIASFPK